MFLQTLISIDMVKDLQIILNNYSSNNKQKTFFKPFLYIYYNYRNWCERFFQ